MPSKQVEASIINASAQLFPGEWHLHHSYPSNKQ